MRGGGKGYSVRNKIFVVDCRILLLSLMEKIHVSLEMKKFGRKTMRSQNALVFFLVLLFSPCTQRSVKSGSVLIRGMKIESTAYIKLLHCAGRLKEVKLLLYADGIHHNL